MIGRHVEYLKIDIKKNILRDLILPPMGTIVPSSFVEIFMILC
jgi:hypothetical protein